MTTQTMPPLGPYPGPLGVVPVPDLPEDERAKERQLTELVQSPGANEQYDALPLTFGGLVINIDLYRELLPEYRLSELGQATAAVRANRTKYTAATYAAAKAASLDRFRRAAATARRVVLLGGGPASGKTLTLRALIGALDPAETVVYDTSLTDYATAKREIEAGLAHGAQVDVVWIYSPFARAIDGMITRAVAEGRYLTLRRMVDLHRGSRETIQALINQTVGISGLTIRVYGGGPNVAAEMALADIPRIFQDSQEDLSHECAQRQYISCEKRLRIPEDLRERICSGRLH